ncbi:MAG: two-component regulator propeller domain-containing protein [Dysgonomonas sp.]|nr:two-component regulator propeller domain-containing protein [Dysgonomonas sp.]
MKKYILFIFLLIQTSFFVCKSNTSDLYFYHLGLQDGLSQINIMSIYQDEFGAMWFGTTEGINRYNGKDIQTFKPTKEGEGFPQNIVYSILGNKAGALYIYADNDLIRYDISAQTFESIKGKGVLHAITTKGNILWVVIDNKILTYDENEKIFRKHLEFDKNITDITSLCVDENKNIWLGTRSGLIRISPDNPNNLDSVIPHKYINTIYEGKDHTIWVGTYHNGLYKISSKGEILNFNHSLEHNSISNNQVRQIMEDNAGRIWVGTFYGLNCYDPRKNSWTNYISSDKVGNSLSHSSIFALYKDIQGTIWVGTYFGGVNYFNSEVDKFRYYGANSTDENYLSFPFVSKMTEDNHGNLWICTEGGALNCLNLEKRRFSRYMFHSDSESVESHNQKCVWYRKDKDRLYIGIHNGGLCIFDINTRKGRFLLPDSMKSHSLPNRTINKMQFYDGMLVLLTQSGFVKMDLETEKFYPISENPTVNGVLASIGTHTFLIDSKDRLWAKAQGRLTCTYLKTNLVKSYPYDVNNKKSFSRFSITDIFENSEGHIFFATTGDGIFRYNEESDDFENYTAEKDGLVSNYCYSISESPSGNLILLYNKGLSFFNYKNPSERLYSSSTDFPLVGFNFGSSVYTTEDNEIFIGGVNGLISFFEKDLQVTDKAYNIYFDKLYINNKLITPYDNSGVLSKTLPLSSNIELKPGQNSISIEFASSNYLRNSTHNYEYKLENFDEDWIPSQNQLITYTNLNPGTYNLLVRETTSGRDNNNPVYHLSLNVKPPFYLSTFAYFIYFILLCVIIWGISKFYSWRTNLETTLLYERREKERIEELNQTKFRFFTNISHEFRTPLTLIIGQLETLLSYNDLGSKVHNKLTKIYKNTNHLQRLITELLDFRKQEQGFAKLNVVSVELISYIKEIYESFHEYAINKKIKYKLEYSVPEIYVYIDPVQFQKAIYNLLSNAFKYTSQDGEIKIQVKVSGEYLEIQIIDNGIGIPPESLSKIFERFYQIEYRSSGLTLGTGIGLALTKEIIVAHKGTIEVDSTVNSGSIFTIKLQQGSSHFSKDELKVQEQNIPQPISKYDIPIEEEIECKDTERWENDELPEKEKPVVLLVDDNEELLKILSENFLPYYHVYTAVDGEAGLNMVFSILPDIVVSDIMMPGMTGKEMCYKIKNNINTSHIPVVLLTAQSSDSQIAEGLMFGADAYIPKPFSIRVLLSYCSNILKNRKLLYEKYASRSEVVPVISDVVSEHDQQLISKAIEIIKANFNNPDFDMNKLGLELGLGRSKLYVKMKEITGLTPNEFTLNLKLQEATDLLQNKSEMNISDIAFYLGFSSSKYFSKCFKSFYGVTPQEWKKRNK